jgi:hypothetical protein
MHLDASKTVNWNDPATHAGVTTDKVFIGPDPFGLGGVQVAVGQAATPPSRQALRALFAARRGKTQLQLVVAIVNGSTTHLFGPDPQAQPIELPTEQAQRQLQSVLDEPDVLAATERIAGFRKAHDSTAVAGFTNSGLFATHHLTQNVPQRHDWNDLNRAGAAMLTTRGQKLIDALGFKTKPATGGAVLLSTPTDASRAVAVLLDDTEQFDSKSPRFQLSPVAYGLAVAAQQEVPWLVVLRKDQIRLYPGRDGIGVGSKGQAETYFEIDLSTVDATFAGLLPLIFTADALAVAGTTDQLLAESTRYATELGDRLRERIYEEIIPSLAVEVTHQLAKHAQLRLDADGLATAYRVTLRILFRLLFQAYAEDRGLLPSGRNEGFDANSLKTNAQRLITTADDEFGDSTTLWRDLTQVWDAIDKGNAQWQIPAYNGGLFSSDPERSPDGALFTKIQIPDRAMGPALKHLLVDTTRDGVDGPVDFRSLSVREFGTIYEGLLESSLSKAEQSLTLDRDGAWVPATKGDEVHVRAGAVYFHSASGERKATGSYFTPKIVVDHLIERSVVPALTTHLDKIADHLVKGDGPAAARDFFDFRVADLAMGSGHFLVAAVDKIEALMRTFLTQHTVPGVTDELLRLASAAKDALGTDDVAKSEVDEVGLLRRQIARRCIYGLDLNPMAVELARLALWIHTFVPGLPMSNLDHGLINADSLTGIGTADEALEVLQPNREAGQASFFDDVLTDTLSSAKTLLIDLANAGEANKAEVEESARLLEQARDAAAPAKRMFDVAVAVRLGEVDADLIFTEDDISELARSPQVANTVDALQPAHMPVHFPEVFLRSNPGFDVLLGNPPWEAPHLKEDRWWNLRFPGLITMGDDEKERRLQELRTQRVDLASAYEEEAETNDFLRSALLALDLPGLGSGHVDLYQVFAWRNWQLLRPGGYSALVLPRGALSGSALASWRRTVLAEGSFAGVCFIENAGRWAFDMEPRYTIGLTVIVKGGERVVRWAGPFASKKAFENGAGDLAEVPAREFALWSSTAAFQLIPGAKSVGIYRQMKRSAPFGVQDAEWSLRPTRGDFLKWKSLPRAGGDPVLIRSGRSFNIWNPDADPARAEVSGNAFRAAYLKYLVTASRNKRSAHYGRSFEKDALPIDRARIALRWISRATDSRTCRVALLPPGCATDDSASVMHRLDGSARHEAFILGVLSSIPFDWQARLLTEMNLTFEVLNQLSIPRTDLDQGIGERVVEISGSLAAVDERYEEWANEVGVPVGSVTTQSEKDDLIAELDALVSLLYGLTEDQVEHVFDTFHRGWNYQSRLEAVLEHYARWKGQA